MPYSAQKQDLFIGYVVLVPGHFEFDVLAA